MKKVLRKLNNKTSVRQLCGYLDKHFDEKKFPVRVTLERYVAKRTNNQNAVMHMWFGEIAEHIGDDPASVKSDIKAMFLPEIEGMHGVMRTKDTHELSNPEMSDFMTQIQVLAAEMNWDLTQPVGVAQ